MRAGSDRTTWHHPRVTTCAVIGLGAMGSRIANRLLEDGRPVVVWNRSPEPIEHLVAAGATTAATPASAAERADLVITHG